MVRDVFLYGRAGKLFGRHFRLSVSDPAEALRALFMLRPGLRAFVRESMWRVIVGTPHIANSIDSRMLGMTLGAQALHFVPATNPRGDNGGVGKIIVGVVLIGAVIISAGALAPVAGATFGSAMAAGIAGTGITFGQVAMLGVSMVLAGISGLLAGNATQQGWEAQPEQRARAEDRPSFLFNGVTNNSQQGGPVPIVVGRHLVGSVVVSGGIAVEDIAV